MKCELYEKTFDSDIEFKEKIWADIYEKAYECAIYWGLVKVKGDSCNGKKSRS